MPEELPQIPLNPVSNNSTTYFLAGGNTQPWRLEIVTAPHNKKTAYRGFIRCGSELKELSPLP